MKNQKKLNISRFLKYSYYRLVRLKFTTHEIALSFAIGAYIGIMPTLGIAMIITFFLCRLFSLSTVAGMIGTWVNNPWTMVPSYYWSYKLGCRIYGISPLREFHKIMVKSTSSSWKEYFELLTENLCGVVLPLMTGSLIVAFAFALVSYVVVYYLVSKYKKIRSNKSFFTKTKK